MKSSLPLFPGMGRLESVIYLDSHPPTFPPYYLGVVRMRQMISPPDKSAAGIGKELKRWIERIASRVDLGTRTHSCLVFQRRTLSPERIWITNDSAEFPSLCLSRQDMALVDFIRVNQAINCQCWHGDLCQNLSSEWLPSLTVYQNRLQACLKIDCGAPPSDFLIQ